MNVQLSKKIANSKNRASYHLVHCILPCIIKSERLCRNLFESTYTQNCILYILRYKYFCQCFEKFAKTVIVQLK